MTGRMLSSHQAAIHCGVSVPLLRKAVEAGELAYYQMGRCWRFRDSDLDAWVESRRTVRRPIHIVRNEVA